MSTPIGGYRRLPVAFSTASYRVGLGYAWSRAGLDRKIRSMLNLAILTALGQPQELGIYVKAALSSGVSVDEIREVLTHANGVLWHAGWTPSILGRACRSQSRRRSSLTRRFGGTSQDSTTRKRVRERTIGYWTGPAGAPIRGFDSVGATNNGLYLQALWYCARRGPGRSRLGRRFSNRDFAFEDVENDPRGAQLGPSRTSSAQARAAESVTPALHGSRRTIRTCNALRNRGTSHPRSAASYAMRYLRYSCYCFERGFSATPFGSKPAERPLL
jgi:hypothetical protein